MRRAAEKDPRKKFENNLPRGGGAWVIFRQFEKTEIKMLGTSQISPQALNRG